MPWARRYERWLLTPEGNHDAAAMHKTVHFVQRTLSFAAVEGWLAEKKLHGYEFQVRALLPPPYRCQQPRWRCSWPCAVSYMGRNSAGRLAVLLLHGPELGRLPPVL